MKSLIKKLLRENLLTESYGPFKDTTTIPDYENLKNGNYDDLPSYYRNMEAEVVYMSPKEYLASCAKIQGTSYEEQLNIVDKDSSKVNKLIDLIDSGVKLNMPYLNFVNGYLSQEGRHRAKAAMDLGYTKIPVLVIKSIEKENKQKLSDMVGVWKDLIKNNYGYKVGFNLNDTKEESIMLNCISKNYDEYFLDKILNTYRFDALYPKGLLSVINKKIIDYYPMDKLSENEVGEFITELPDEYEKLLSIDYDNASDEEYKEWNDRLKEMIIPLMNLGMLFIMEHNKDVLSQIFEYDYNTKIGYLFINQDVVINDDYSSAKDMLLNIKLYDNELNFYSCEKRSDLYKMDYSFIEKYKELLPEKLGGVKVR
jgi:hypothetical protein